MISIAKLCTTERDPGEAKSLIERALAHLSKCQIGRLHIRDCVMLLEWDIAVSEPHSHLSDLRNTSQ